MTLNEDAAAELAAQQRRIGCTAVPFGWSSETERAAWRREYHQGPHAGEWQDARLRAHEVAYAYAIGWCEGRFPIVNGRRVDGEFWDDATGLALRFADEYERQEWIWHTHSPVHMNTKRGYGLWWPEIVRAYDLHAV